MNVEAKKQYIIEHPKNQDTDEELPEVFFVHIDRPLGRLRHAGLTGFDGLMKHLLMNVNGIDRMEPRGFLSFSVIVGQCFDPAEVEAAIITELRRFLSEIEVPNPSLKLVGSE